MNNREKVISLACVWLTMTAVGGNFGFGPGHLSEFRISDAEVGYVAGVSGLRWSDFSPCEYAGEKNGTASRSYLCFENANIVDGEKNAQVDSDDYWCPAITDMNLLIWSGWASKAGFTDEDALVDHFRARPRLIVEAINDEPQWNDAVYDQTGVFDWFRDQTQIDLSGYVENFAGFGSGFASVVERSIASADRLINFCVWFDTFVWKGDPGVGHCVTCCGYSCDPTKAADDPNRLKALFVIDSDNDMFNGAGAASAPDRITYCPVSWTGENYRLSNVFGTTGELFGDAKSLRTQVAPTLNKTSDLADGGKEPVEPGQAVTEGIVAAASISKATVLYGCVRAGTTIVGSVELKLGKDSKGKGSKVSGSLTLFGGKKQTLKAKDPAQLSKGPASVTLSVARAGDAVVMIGKTASGTLAFSGSYGGYTLESAVVGGEHSKSAYFGFVDQLPASINGGMVNADFLPEGEPVTMSGKKWKLAAAAAVKYAKDRATGAYGWVVNNGKINAKKTNLSGLKLTYTSKTGLFKGSFKVYTLVGTKMKKVSVSVNGLVVGGNGYGAATVKKGGSYAVKIDSQRPSSAIRMAVPDSVDEVVSSAAELRTAIENAVDGTTIYLRNGTYLIDKSLPVRKSIALVGESTDGVVIVGDEENGLNGLYFGFFDARAAINAKVFNCTFTRMDVRHGATVLFQDCRQTSTVDYNGLLCYAQDDDAPAVAHAVNCSFRSATCSMGSNASIVLDNCTIDQTGSDHWGLYATKGSLTANSSTVVGGGNGVFAFNGSVVIVNDCVIRNAGCAVGSFSKSSVTLNGCTIEGCAKEQNTYEGGRITIN